MSTLFTHPGPAIFQDIALNQGRFPSISSPAHDADEKTHQNQGPTPEKKDGVFLPLEVFHPGPLLRQNFLLLFEALGDGIIVSLDLQKILGFSLENIVGVGHLLEGPPALSGEKVTTILVHLTNQSLHNKYIQVKDEICMNSLPGECTIAELVLESSECQENRRSEKCREAREISSQAACVEGLVFSGDVDRGESIAVEICINHTGKGKLAVRNSPTGPWVHHNWVSAGDKIAIR